MDEVHGHADIAIAPSIDDGDGSASRHPRGDVTRHGREE